MKIAVEGCAHGELEKIYDTIKSIEQVENIKVDLLLCCGDFQATRNLEDLQTMAVPKKYRNICTFYKYYSGELIAPILTIFIGGNHEASNYLQELPYGGWVAPNIYYLGYAGVILVNGIRVAGISGIYKRFDYLHGHYEFSPYTEKTCRSVYHVRQLEVFRLKQLSGKVDVFMSHDWPRGIHNYGNKMELLNSKPQFADDIENNQLGSWPCADLLNSLHPEYWFAAHLHCKFAAIVPHDNTNYQTLNTSANEDVRHYCYTKFLALDKCLPKRKFLQVLDIKSKAEYVKCRDLILEHDLEWLTILCLTNHLLSVKNVNNYMPSPSDTSERYDFTPTHDELEKVLKKFGGNLKISPTNFCRTVHAFDPTVHDLQSQISQPQPQINPQCLQFCEMLGIDDPLKLVMLSNGLELKCTSDFDLKAKCAAVKNTLEGNAVKKKKTLSLSAPQMIVLNDLDKSTYTADS